MSAQARKMIKVKDKSAAPVQISAEQILREAKERMLEVVPPPVKQTFANAEELAEFKRSKRQEFEDSIRKNRTVVSNWLKYAGWEESHNELDRARSVYERALDVDPRNLTIWLRYAEMEMKNRQVNHARNLWDRATTMMPRVEQFWYKYTYMEEILGNVAAARNTFERWMEWHPDQQAWFSYIKMELRYGEIDRARAIYEKFVLSHIDPKIWIRYANFEVQHHEPERARQVFTRAIEFFGDDNLDEGLFIAFAKFEEIQREYERARVIYKYSLDKIPKERAKELFAAYTAFEKKHGDRAGVEDLVLAKRKLQYEKEVTENPRSYDAWFDYVRLVEGEGDHTKTRDVYERAIANIPLAADKRYWRRYIYLWIYYALFEELEAEDIDRTRAVYKACLQILPHKKFTFAKIWLLFAQFEIRQKRLAEARRILGEALGRCPKAKLFKSYIELELQSREFDRCRTLYNKFLEFDATNCKTWIKYAELETILGDSERARAIFELAIAQPALDMPELLWKSYIDFECEIGEYDLARQLYERLLERTQHVKVWISYARFELTTGADDAVDQARNVYEIAEKEVKKSDDKSERLVLLESWLDFERTHGTPDNVRSIQAKMPKKVKRKREIIAADGTVEGWEEYYDYTYPDEQGMQPNKLLEMAHRWKMMQQMQAQLPTQPQHDDQEESAGAVSHVSDRDGGDEEVGDDQSPQQRQVPDSHDNHGDDGEEE